MEIRKIENSDYVMFPRLQRPGLSPKHVAFESFKAELKHIEGHGDFWLLYQQDKPHLVVHVQLPKNETEFDNILGFCIGQNKWCDYIEDTMPKNSLQSTPTSSKSACTHSTIPFTGGTSTAMPCSNSSFQPKEAEHRALSHSAVSQAEVNRH